MSRKAGLAIIITLLYIPLFLFLDNSRLSFRSIIRLFQTETPSVQGETSNATGPDTYRIDFTSASSICTTCDSSGYLLNGGKNYSPGLKLRLGEVFSDSLTVIKTQARIRRNSADSLHFLFVVTIETPGVKEPWWNASYGLDGDFQVGQSAVLNGRLKLEGYPINEASVLNAYLWNVGASAISIEHLEIILGTDPPPRGNDVLIEQFEGQYLQPRNGYQPFLSKTKLAPVQNHATETMAMVAGGKLFSEGEHLYLLDTTSITRFAPDGSSIKSSLTYHTGKAVFPAIGANGDVILFTNSSKNMWKVLNPFNSMDAGAGPIDLGEGVWIAAESDHLFPGMEMAWMERSGDRIIVLKNGRPQDFACRWTTKVERSVVLSLKRLGPQQFLVFAQVADSIRVFNGYLNNQEVEIRPVQWNDPVHEAVLDLSPQDQFIPLVKNQFLVVSRDWRFAMHRCLLRFDGQVSILEGYFPQAKAGDLPPFYHEALDGAMWGGAKGSIIIRATMRGRDTSVQPSYYSIPLP